MQMNLRRKRPNGSGRDGQPWVLDPKTKWQFDIDVVGSCNLRCPSCPVGNSWEARTPLAYMRPEMLDRIVDKATTECRVVGIYLYNWTEPLLHPRLAEMIRVVQGHGVPCGLSTNLNVMPNLDAVMEANPHMLKVSLSGFTQETYGVTHRRGDIEVVKRNMAEVARAKARSGATTRLVVAFHRYLGNHEDEDRMSALCESLGFEFEPAWAYLMPFEKMLAFADPAAADVRLTDDDHALIDRLALPLDAAVKAARRDRNRPCALQDRQMAITAQGDVMLCCTVFDQSKYKLAPFLDTPLAALQEMKYGHATCDTCMNNGLHVLFTYGSEDFDSLALERVRQHHPDARLKGAKQLQLERRPRGVRGWPRKIREHYGRVASRLGIGD